VKKRITKDRNTKHSITSFQNKKGSYNLCIGTTNNIFKQKSHFPFVFPRLFAPSCEKKNHQRPESQTFNHLLPKIKKALTTYGIGTPEQYFQTKVEFFLCVPLCPLRLRVKKNHQRPESQTFNHLLPKIKKALTTYGIGTPEQYFQTKVEFSLSVPLALSAFV
jgi:hypothetical protein